MKYFYLILCLFVTSVAFGQAAGDFQSHQTGNWDLTTTWEQFDGVSWVTPAPSTPTDADGIITILTGHTVTIAADVSIDDATVNVGGTIILNSGINLDFPGFAFADVFTINGTLNNSGSFNAGILSNIQINGTFINNEGGTFNNADPGWVFFNANSTYNHRYTITNGELPLASWDDASTCLVSGYTTNATAPLNLNQEFGNFTWNTPLFANGSNFISLGGALTTVDGNFRVIATGTSGAKLLRLAGVGDPGYTLEIGGDLLLDGGTIQFAFNTSSLSTINVHGNYSHTLANLVVTQTAGDVTVNFSKNFSKTGGSISRIGAGVATFNFNGGGVTQTYGFNGAVVGAINFSVESGSVLSLGTSTLTGTGTLTNNGTIILGSTDAIGAIQAGSGNAGNNIRVTGIRTYAAGSTLVYRSASGVQHTGGGFPTASDINVEIDNSSGVVMDVNITISAAVLPRTLTLTSGSLTIGNHTLTINGTITGSGGLVGGSTSNVTIGGSGSMGLLTFTSGQQLNNFSLNRSSTGIVTLGSNLTISGTLTQTLGDIDLNGHTLTVSGPFARTNGSFTADAAATLIINGSGSLPAAVTFDGAQALNTLTINRASSIFATNSTLTITNLNLLAGTFNNTGTITMGPSGVITRTEGSIINNTPQTLTSYDIIYNIATDISTGSEIPSLTTQLRNVSKTGGAQLTLAQAITINGNLTLTNGSFNASTFAIDLKGNLVANAASTLTSSPFTFSGTTIISGGSILQFGAVTIAGTVTPTIDIRIDGNLINNGTLVVGTGAQTFTFGGNTAISGSSATFLNNVTISGTLVAPTGNLNVVGAWTNNGAFTRGAASNTVTFSGTTSISGSTTTNFSGIVISGTLNGPSSLNLAGNFTNNGTFNSGTGTVLFNGTSTQAIQGSAVTNFNNITVVNSSGPPAVRVQTNQNLFGVLRLSGATTQFDADGSGNTSIFTLVSSADDPTVDAAIATIPVGASVIGNVTVQRYMAIEGASSRIYRFISSPVQSVAVSDIQNEIPITGSFTGSSACTGCGIAQSMFQYNENVITDTNGSGGADLNDGYVDFPDLANSETLVNGRGYTIFVRGNAPPISTAGSARWDVRAPINSGAITFNAFTTFTSSGTLANDGWNLVGNPYPSTIDWDANLVTPGAWTKTGINDAIYMMDNGLISPVFATYIGGVGTNGGSNFIATGQAFFVKSDGGPINFIVTENAKVGGTQTTYFRQGSISNLLRIALKSATVVDESVIRFNLDATDEFDSHLDAYKLKNPAINLSSVTSQGKTMAINSLPLLQCTRIVKLDVSNVLPGAYHFDFSNLQSFDPAVKILAHDVFAANSSWIDLRAQSGLDFQVTTDSASFGSDRFVLSFGYDNQLPVTLDLTADGVCGANNSKISVNNTSTGLNYFAKINGAAVTPVTAGNGQTLSLTIDKSNLKQGDNTVSIVSQSPNCATLTLSQDVLVKVDDIYSAKSNGSMNCREGSVTLTASGASANGSYNWYDKADATSPIAGQSGSQFLTPSLAKTATYFVSAVNSIGCEGERIPVVATIVNYDDAAISVVDDKTLRSNYATGNHWYLDGQLLTDTTASISIRSSGLYALEVKVGACTTRDEKSLVVTGLGENGSGIRAYPNPVSGMYSLEIPAEKSDADDLPVFNTVGGQIGTMKLTRQGSTKKGQFDFSSHSAGFYYIRAVSAASITVIKVIKN